MINNYISIHLFASYRIVIVVIKISARRNARERERKEKRGPTFRRCTEFFFPMFLVFLCVYVDDKKMERLFSSVPSKHIKKRDRDTTIADR